MTIQVNISEKELQQKIDVVRRLSVYCSLISNTIFDISYYVRNINYCQERLNDSGHYQEIYSDLQHIEKMLIEFLAKN